MPGLTVCFRCGSVLAPEQVTVDVHPPRASGWQKPLRGLRRWARRHSPLPPLPSEPAVRAMIEQSRDREYRLQRAQLAAIRLAWLMALWVLSILPGVSHGLQRRFGEIRFLWLGWIAGLVLGLFWLGGIFGAILLGLGVALHGVIAVHGSFFRVLKARGPRLAVVVVSMAVLGVMYWQAGRWAFSDVETSYAPFDIPGRGIYRGDVLLFRPSLAGSHPQPRGAVVRAVFDQVHNEGGNAGRYTTTGQIVGLPGEELSLRDKVFFVNGRALDSQNFPAPRWMQTAAFSCTILPGHYFVTTEFKISGDRRRVSSEMIVRAGRVPYDRVEARAFMRWLPVYRRGYIRERP